MKTRKPFFLSVGFIFFLTIFALSLWMPRGITPCLAANDLLDAKKLVESSKHTLEGFMSDPNYTDFRTLLKKVRGIYITPSMLKGPKVCMAGSLSKGR